MIPNRPFRQPAQTARDKLLEAGLMLVRQQGFSATSLDQLCQAEGVTKGGFFHHFVSKPVINSRFGFWALCCATGRQ